MNYAKDSYDKLIEKIKRINSKSIGIFLLKDNGIMIRDINFDLQIYYDEKFNIIIKRNNVLVPISILTTYDKDNFFIEKDEYENKIIKRIIDNAIRNVEKMDRAL